MVSLAPILRLRFENPRSIQRDPGSEKAIAFLRNVGSLIVAHAPGFTHPPQMHHCPS